MEGLEQSPEPVVLMLDAVPASVPVARCVVTAFARDCEADAVAVALATSEAVTNAVVHAYRDAEPGPLRLSAMLEEDLLVRVRDEGVGMKPDLDSPGAGYGISLIGALCAASTFLNKDSGLEVMMRFPALATAQTA